MGTPLLVGAVWVILFWIQYSVWPYFRSLFREEGTTIMAVVIIVSYALALAWAVEYLFNL